VALDSWPVQVAIQRSDPGAQGRQIAVVDNDVIRTLHHLAHRRLGFQPLTHLPFILATVAAQPEDDVIIRCGHHPEAVHHVPPAGLDKERCFNCRVGMTLELQTLQFPLHPATSGGMHYGVEPAT